MDSGEESDQREGSGSPQKAPANVLTPDNITIPKEKFPRNKLVTIFEKETKEEVEARKKKGYLPLDMYHRNHPWWENIESETVIEMPKRPEWTYKMTADKLEEQERKGYEEWMKNILHQYGPRLNYFEKNLEVWRQLWRVLEKSDVILLVADARFPLFHFPPSLYTHVVHELKKPIILVLNKADIVDKNIVDQWEAYLMDKYPSLKIVRFSSFRAMTEGALEVEKKRKLEKGRRKYENAGGRKILLEAVRQLGIKKKGKIIEIPEISVTKNSDESDSSDDDSDKEDQVDEEAEKTRDWESVITIGTVGHPNVGKSSLINGLVGKKVVSTSRTPGHTKHFQTIFLTSEVLLCDCPGLVFPALDRPKDLQVLCGVFPIAQVRETFSAIRYLAERVPVEKVYNLKPPEEGDPWSPFTIAEAYALKRGYLLARTGAPDVHRAGGEILRDCLDGNIVISWPPPSNKVAVDTTTTTTSSAAPTPAEDKDVEMKNASDKEESSDGESTFAKNKKKKRERKLKKKQSAFVEQKAEVKAIKKSSKKPADNDDDKPSYYDKMQAKQRRVNKHQGISDL